MAREDFLKYAESYSGIDGGDIGAEYWFMGMEWSNIDDIKGDYNEKTNTWKEKPFPVEEVKILTEDGKEDKKWKLENAMDKLYQILLPNNVSGKVIFQKKSNSLKLNLLPLPFLNEESKDGWDKIRLREATGFSCFDEYIGKKPYTYENSVIPARYKLFQKLLQKGKSPKTIFCFGTSYKAKFIKALTDNQRNPKLKVKLPESKCNGGNLEAIVYNVNNQKINRIIISPFPYYKKIWNFASNDWERIRFIAQEDWKKVCDLAKE